MSDQRIINDFMREHADPFAKREQGMIRPGGKFDHSMQVCKICCLLAQEKIPFYTELKLKCGVRPDVIAFTPDPVVIEVMHSETIDDWHKKKGAKYEKAGIRVLVNTTKDEINDLTGLI